MNFDPEKVNPFGQVFDAITHIEEALDDPDFHQNDFQVLTELYEERRRLEDLLERMQLPDDVENS